MLLNQAAGGKSRRAEKGKIMKTYIATFWRGNPQSKNGGYETTRTIEARTQASAEKKARAYEKCIYGSMSLIKVELKQG